MNLTPYGVPMFGRQQIIIERLRNMILSGDVQAGNPLREVSLSERLGVSRTPIREALIVLAEEGLLEYRQNRGYIVRSFTTQEILDAYVVRESLEVLAVRLAAENGLSEERDRLMQQCLAAGDELFATPKLSYSLHEPWRRINGDFHRLIVEAANNSPLSSALQTTMRIPFVSTRVMTWLDGEEAQELFRLRHINSQHHSIYEAIRARDAYQAETAMRWHLARAIKHVRDRFSEHPLP
jgi:GntR family transcriptional regulator, vanillate catabolism transcriptional regulator